MCNIPCILIILITPRNSNQGLCLLPGLISLFISLFDYFVFDLRTYHILCKYLEWYKSRLEKNKPALASALAGVIL